MTKKIVVLAAALLALTTSSAFAIEKGNCMFAIQLSTGQADLYDPTSVASFGYISAYEHSENGVEGQFWYMMSDDYAFTVSGGLGFFSEEDKPGAAATPGSPTFKYSQSSYNFRIGGDRVVNIGPRALIYFGPGLELWSGKNKFEDTATIESENVTRFSLQGRMGGVMMIGSGWGFAGDMGHKIGYASAEDQGAKVTWWPSSLDARGGLLFRFD